jgi:SAM-dependent methyltransferase
MVSLHATRHRQGQDKAFGTDALAWTQFWEEQGPGSRCLAQASHAFQKELDGHWRGFAGTLARGARVLDIGCGAGAVAQLLGAGRRDLRIVGIDLAEIPCGPPVSIEIVSGTAMEDLPFPDASFDAAVSQFGYEYGQAGEAARELARVMRPGAPFSFLVHHGGSVILASSRSHLEVLKALSGSRIGSLFKTGEERALDEELARLANRYPGEHIIEQAARGLHRQIGAGEAVRAKTWKAVTEALQPGIILETALLRSCVAPQDLDRWLDPLRDYFQLKPASVLELNRSRPIAWKIQGARKLGISRLT